MRRTPRLPLVALVLLASLLSAAQAGAQSVLERTPNLSGGWVGAPGTAYFNFLHRFEHGPAPTHKVTNFPTFLLGYSPGARLLVAVQYATNSDLVSAYPNEWEALVRWAAPAAGSMRAAFTAAWNQAAESVDGEAQLKVRAARLSLLGTARAFSSGYGGEGRLAVGGGVVLRLGSGVALASDAVTLLGREAGEEIAWGAGLQLRIPYTPHTLSLQATNTNTATLQGSSRGGDATRYGFEFTIPITLSRWFGGRRDQGGDAVVRTGSDTVIVRIRDFEFVPARITVSSGTTIVWVNEGQGAHTSTADDGSWDSGMLEPGERWSRTFTAVGEYPYHCTPHPFMTGTVVVEGRDR